MDIDSGILYHFNTLYSLFVAFGFALSITSFQERIIRFFDFSHLESWLDSKDKKSTYFNEELSLLNGVIEDVNTMSSSCSNSTQVDMVRDITALSLNCRKKFIERQKDFFRLISAALFTRHFNVLSLVSGFVALMMIFFATLEQVCPDFSVYFERYVLIGIVISIMLLFFFFICDVLTKTFAKPVILYSYFIAAVVTIILGALSSHCEFEITYPSWKIGVITVLYCGLHYICYLLYVIYVSLRIKSQHSSYKETMKGNVDDIKMKWGDYKKFIKPEQVDFSSFNKVMP